MANRVQSDIIRDIINFLSGHPKCSAVEVSSWVGIPLQKAKDLCKTLAQDGLLVEGSRRVFHAFIAIYTIRGVITPERLAPYEVA
jgi:hypothetical protein